MKKDHSVLSQIPTRRQLLPYPPSKLSPQKTAVDPTQKEPKNTGLVSSGVSLTSWGEGASLALVAHPSSDGVPIKMPYGVDVLHRPASHPIFSYWVG